MCLISSGAVGRTLSRFVFASVVRIALSTTVSTLHPSVAHETAFLMAGAAAAGAGYSVEQADTAANLGAANNPVPVSDFVGAEPGPGWG